MITSLEIQLVITLRQIYTNDHLFLLMWALLLHCKMHKFHSFKQLHTYTPHTSIFTVGAGMKTRDMKLGLIPGPEIGSNQQLQC